MIYYLRNARVLHLENESIIIASCKCCGKDYRVKMSRECINEIFSYDKVLAPDLWRLREALSFATIAAYSVEDFVLAYKKYDPNDWYGMDWNGNVEVNNGIVTGKQIGRAHV